VFFEIRLLFIALVVCFLLNSTANVPESDSSIAPLVYSRADEITVNTVVEGLKKQWNQ